MTDRPNTIRSYEPALRVHIAPSAVAGIKVAEVRRGDLQALVDDLLAAGLSAGTVSNVLNPIQAFYRRAIDRDELSHNPSERIDLPHGRSKRPKRIASKDDECRHTFASLLIDAGANPKAIQQFMGHSKIQTTFDVYGHLLPGSHDEVRQRMDGYLRGGEDDEPAGAG